jgi:23S rRNA (guanosine2251-2'-O)-methyltransferase
VQVIFGINPLMEALKSQNGRIRKIVIAKGRGGETVQRIMNLAEQNDIPVEFRERGYLDRQAGQKIHQGVIGFRETFTYVDVDDVIANRHVDFDNNLILIFDGIMDPQNLGSLIRTAHCCGANGVIIPENRSAAVTAAVIKASAGAVCHTPVAMVVNLSKRSFTQENGEMTPTMKLRRKFITEHFRELIEKMYLEK